MFFYKRTAGYSGYMANKLDENGKPVPYSEELVKTAPKASK